MVFQLLASFFKYLVFFSPTYMTCVDQNEVIRAFENHMKSAFPFSFSFSIPALNESGREALRSFMFTFRLGE